MMMGMMMGMMMSIVMIMPTIIKQRQLSLMTIMGMITDRIMYIIIIMSMIKILVINPAREIPLQMRHRSRA